MKRKIEKYIDDLFDDIVRELKEEMASDLMEKTNDFKAGGYSEEEAFERAVLSLGGKNELVDNLIKASQAKGQKKQVKDALSGALWIFAAAFFLVGMVKGLWYFWIIFIFAVGFQLLLEAYFQSKKGKF